jgi:hypothetical protein
VQSVFDESDTSDVYRISSEFDTSNTCAECEPTDYDEFVISSDSAESSTSDESTDSAESGTFVESDFSACVDSETSVDCRESSDSDESNTSDVCVWHASIASDTSNV